MKKIASIGFIAAMLFLMALGCQGKNKAEVKKQNAENNTGEQTMANFDLQSPAFQDGDTIPEKYTCDGRDISVPLKWSGVPANTKSLALIADDPDAPMGTWVHWVVFNIPKHVQELHEAVSFKADSSFSGTIEGKTDFGRTGYGGPCPPRGPAHRYFFKLYALDTTLDLTDKATKADLEKAMKGHILASGIIVGKYARKR